ncbi:MAG TPA: glutamine amidotransferase [Pirellulales bacterium]|nr:glutamine amidotransferase [Pirellulales bacterium]
MMIGALELESVRHAWLWLLLLAAGSAALVVTYRTMRESGRQRLAWILLLLRAAGLAALVVALARPVWSHVAQRIDPGRVAIVLDDSLSMSLADSSGQSRFALARAAAERLAGQIAASDQEHEMAVDYFDLLAGPLDVLPEEPRAERTDLVGAVRHAVTRLRARPLTSVVLISDGADNSAVDRLPELADLPVPIFTVGFENDADSSRLDLAVRGVKAPDRVNVNNEVKVDVLIGKQSGPAMDAILTFRRGRQSFASQTISLPEGDAEQWISVPLRPSEPGTFVYTAAIAAEAGERLAANNARHFPLQVDADAIKVFYLEGFLRYEYKFLKNRLEDDPDVSLVSIVRRANPRAGSASQGALLTPERLRDFEVVILGDLEAADLSDAEYRALVDWVEAGHALLVVGGYHSFGTTGFRGTPVAEALPVVFAEGPVLQSEDPFVLQLTEQGRQHPIFQLSGDRVKDAAQWKTSPHLSGVCLVERAKPGADVLAVDPSFTTAAGPAVVVAAQRYGAGHTMVIAADTTWHWSRLPRVAGQADTLYARFWSQTIRWLAGRQLQGDRPPLVVTTDRPDYEVGKPIEIRALRQPAADESPTDTLVRAAIVDENGVSIAVPLQAASSRPDLFLGTWHPTSGGRYQVEAALFSGDQAVANESTEFLVNGSELELAEPDANPERLRAMAKRTGGLYFDIHQVDQLPDRIERRERRLSRIERADLWASGKLRSGLFAFFLIAITAEWLLRRRNHWV